MAEGDFVKLTLIEHCDMARRLLEVERHVVMLARGLRETRELDLCRSDLEHMREEVRSVRLVCSKSLMSEHPNLSGAWKRLYTTKKFTDIDALAAGLSGASGIESMLVEAGEDISSDTDVELKKLDGYTRGYVRYQFWSCPHEGIVRVEHDTTPGIDETRVAIESSVCFRCCRVEGDCDIDSEPRLVSVAPCWREDSLIPSDSMPRLFS